MLPFQKARSENEPKNRWVAKHGLMAEVAQQLLPE